MAIALAKLSLAGAAPAKLAARPKARSSAGFNQRAARTRRTVIRLASVSRIFFTTFLHSSRADWLRGFNFKNLPAGSMRIIQPRPDRDLVIMRHVGNHVKHPDVWGLGIVRRRTAYNIRLRRT